MCQQINCETSKKNMDQHKLKTCKRIKEVLKTFFKKHHKRQQHHQYESNEISTSIESLDNLRNIQMEQTLYEEIDENLANEKLDQITNDDADQEIYIPVRFARTEAGTFFWTTNLQPVMSTIVPSVDDDLIQPAYCYSNQQFPYMQFQDRWAQA